MMEMTKDRFTRLLDAAPILKPYWDLQRRECDVEALKAAMGGMVPWRADHGAVRRRRLAREERSRL